MDLAFCIRISKRVAEAERCHIGYSDVVQVPFHSNPFIHLQPHSSILSLFSSKLMMLKVARLITFACFRDRLGGARCFGGNGERGDTFVTEGRETRRETKTRLSIDRSIDRARAGFSVGASRRQGRWRSERDPRPQAPGPGARRPEKDVSVTRGRSKAPSVFWTSSLRRCGTRFSNTSRRTTSFPWL